MNYQIKWGDMKTLLEKRFKLQEENNSPVFYFESDEQLNIYQSNDGYTVYSLIPKSAIDDLQAFKRQYLINATELIQLPQDKTTLVIKQE